MNVHEWGDRRMEMIIGILLRLGVMVAGAVVFFGAIIYLIRNGAAPLPDYKSFHGESLQLSTVEGILAGVLAREIHRRAAEDPRRLRGEPEEFVEARARAFSAGDRFAPPGANFSQAFCAALNCGEFGARPPPVQIAFW